MIKRLALPWLTLQTRFNHGLIDLLERQNADLRTTVGALVERLDRQEQMIQSFGIRLSDGVRDLDPQRTPDPATPRMAQETFLLSWLPRPPARVLHLSAGSDDVSLGLGRFGYETDVADRGTAGFADGSFHAVVSLDGAISEPLDAEYFEEIYRLLRPDGRFIVRVAGAEIDRLPLDGFRVLETMPTADGNRGEHRSAFLAAERV